MTPAGAWFRRVTGGALIAGLVLAAPTAAASNPIPLTTARTVDPLPVGLAFDASGRAVASWRTFVGVPEKGRLRHIFAVTDRAGNWRRPVALRGAILEHELAVTGPRAAFAVWRQKPAGRRFERSLIQVVIVDTASGAIRRVRTLAVGPPRRVTPEGTPATLLSPRVAATPKGRLVVAWVRSDSRRFAGVWVTTMRRDGRIDRPQRLAPLGGNPQLSIGSDGRGMLAWQRGHRIQVRLRRASGHWGRIEHAATTVHAVTWGIDSIDIAAGSGKYAVGLEQTARSAAGVRVYSTVHTRGAGGGWRSRLVGDFTVSGAVDFPRVLTFVTSDGRLHAAWPALAGGHVGVVGATFEPDASAPVPLSPAEGDASLQDAAVGPHGSFAIAWLGAEPGLTEVDGTGAVRMATGFATGRALRGAKVAYDVRSGRLMVVWSQGTSAHGYRPFAWTA